MEGSTQVVPLGLWVAVCGADHLKICCEIQRDLPLCMFFLQWRRRAIMLQANPLVRARNVRM